MSDSEFGGGAKQGNKSHHVSKNKLKKKNAKSKFSFSDVKKRSRDSDNEENEAASNGKGGRRGEEADTDEKSALKAKLRNPKAFALQSYVAAERNFRRTQDIKAKRLQVPEVDRTPLEPPPVVVALVGPPKVGKSILMKNLIRNYTRQKLNNIVGPVTVVAGKNKRFTFIECNNDLNSMIDVAKVADLVLLMIDASFGFEMETFEFLNVCQVHGFPRIMGVLTHMDLITNMKQLKKTKKRLKHRFWTEIYQGAKLFYLTGLVNNEYRKHEVHNLARFISVMKFKDFGFRSNHPYVIADRIEDLTHPNLIRQDSKCDRTVCLYGYVRGCPIKKDTFIHIPGCGDYQVSDISSLSDPCPLPDKEKKRTLDDRERLLYSPFSGVGGIVYDKDAVYIELGGSHSHKSERSNEIQASTSNSTNPFLNKIIGSKQTIDAKMDASKIQLFSNLNSDEIRTERDEDDEDEDDFDDDDDQEEDEDGFNESEDEEEDDSEDEDDDDDDDEEDEEDEKETKLFRRGIKKNSKKLDDDFFKIKKLDPNKDAARLDNSAFETEFMDWNGLERENNDAFDSIKDCFVTGKWEAGKDARTRLDNDDMLGDDDDEDLFGDFEDFETGEVYKNGAKRVNTDGGDSDGFDEDEYFNGDDGSGDDDDEEEEGKGEGKPARGDKEEEKKRTKTKNEMTKRERLVAKKKRLKEQFDAEFDGEKSGEGAYYDQLLQDVDERSTRNRLELEKMDEQTRIDYEGYRPGMYVRVEIKNMPYEFIENFDPRYLAILGGLGVNESNIGYVQVRMKKHRWHQRILKNQDPLIVSLGWRRFQTIPLYFIQDHNMRNRSLKYTPQHMYCHAIFWGPITPQNTGFLAVQSLSNEVKDFRIAATGVVIDINKSTEIVKKLKLIGTPNKIFRKTAFIQGMFSTALEASKFEGASVKTVSGIRGQIKKALRSSSVPAGAVRVTFEDKILASDSVFMRTWYPLTVPKFYAPVTTLLAKPGAGKNEWEGLKTLGSLKREKGVQAKPNQDSLYKPITRDEKVFAPLKIRRNIEEQLPFAFKNKENAVTIDPIKKQRVAILRDAKEAKMASAMKMFKSVYDTRMQAKEAAHAASLQKHKKDQEKIELKRLQKSKEAKKIIYRRLGKQQNAKSRHGQQQHDD